MHIRPFRALRPEPRLAQQVACPPYDVMSTAEAMDMASGQACRFLHVTRPEIDLPPDADAHSQAAYDQAATALRTMQDEGVLVREKEPCLYVYSQRIADHEQTGVVCGCSVTEYESGVIRRHEHTLRAKEDDRTRHILALGAQTGPVLLACPDHAPLLQQMEQARAREPLFEVRAGDGVTHTLWRITETQPWIDTFAHIPCAYIADGHHRAASAARVAEQRRREQPEAGTEAPFNWFLSVIFPAGQLRILPYNRVVRDLRGQTPQELLASIEQQGFRVTPSREAAPAHGAQACLYLAGAWYKLDWEVPSTADPVAALDASVLQRQLLAPCLGIDDPRTDERIAFVGGIRGVAELERLVDGGHHAMALSLFPVSMNELMAVSDAHLIMPPKSTWFEPKLLSGLFVHVLDGLA